MLITMVIHVIYCPITGTTVSSDNHQLVGLVRETPIGWVGKRNPLTFISIMCSKLGATMTC